ncbi:hypothetical protein B0H15DRAFT_953290 [Mycena belliarum]|uniref:FAD-binding domain-containing protein n=1 Tax=Mycena belliarum TaxID=1033014 RepID=A0AAD6TVB8_9AGAR|nr:hypothetical protein B0H15DRAFT_953290 [Mycena belliae]
MTALSPKELKVQPLNISIVGAGIAGLSAAIALRRNGHIVQIFESAEVVEEIGAAIAIPVNSQRVLERFGYSKENLKSVPYEGVVPFDSVGGKAGITAGWLVPSGKHNLLCHRSDLCVELQRLALGPGEGPPAMLHTGSQVVGCDTESGTLKLKDGRIIPGDVILGADGISSTVRTHVLGHVVKTVGSGWSCYRTVLDAEKVADIDWLHDGVSGVRTVIFHGSPFRMILTYPCRSGTLLNFLAAFDDPTQESPDWPTSGTRADVQALFTDFAPRFHPLLAVLPDRVPRWQMRTVPVVPTWARGRTAILGDAAHGTMPTLGQGAAMAVEDAATLGVLLQRGTPRADVPARLAAYETLRKPRGEWLGARSLEQAVSPIHRGEYMRSEEMQKYMMEYDVFQAAEECYQELFASAPKI